MRQAGRDVQEIGQLLQLLGVEQQVQEAARDVPLLVFLHCRRVVRGRLLFWRKRIESYVYLVMRRRDAVRFGVLDRVRVLPAREQTLLHEHFDCCPEEPVGLRIGADDDDGGEGPPAPPPPEPEQRDQPDDVPTRDRVPVA